MYIENMWFPKRNNCTGIVVIYYYYYLNIIWKVISLQCAYLPADLKFICIVILTVIIPNGVFTLNLLNTCPNQISQPLPQLDSGHTVFFESETAVLSRHHI